MTGHVEFLLNGEKVRVSNPDPTCTVLNFLREEHRLTGTKEGCREGDCGACTVTQIALVDGVPNVRAINACIQFLPTVHGTAIYTVEGVAGSDGALHPVQAAMVSCHGSQCGFCTPGFVMSLHAAALSGEVPNRPRIAELLAGNLCRCTGYGPIMAAAEQSLGTDADGSEQLAEITEQLKTLQSDDMLVLAHDCPRRKARLRYVAPRSRDELVEVLAQFPDATILAGGTDLGLLVTKQHRVLQNIVDINHVRELREIEVTPDEIIIGAAVTYSAARAHLARTFPGMDDFLSRIASEQIRNSGTIGGNIANGSPIGDMPPAFIALDAQIELIGPNGKRMMSLGDFFIAYGKQDRRPDECVSRIVIPKLADTARFEVYKISKRFDQDISAVCAGFYATVRDGAVHDVRMAFGGMAGTPKRARAAEAVLDGRQISPERIEAAVRALGQDFTPLSDHRASARYRLLVAGNLLRKFCASISGDRQVRLDREGAL